MDKHRSSAGQIFLEFALIAVIFTTWTLVMIEVCKKYEDKKRSHFFKYKRDVKIYEKKS